MLGFSLSNCYFLDEELVFHVCMYCMITILKNLSIRKPEQMQNYESSRYIHSSTISTVLFRRTFITNLYFWKFLFSYIKRISLRSEATKLRLKAKRNFKACKIDIIPWIAKHFDSYSLNVVLYMVLLGLDFVERKIYICLSWPKLFEHFLLREARKAANSVFRAVGWMNQVCECIM